MEWLLFAGVFPEPEPRPQGGRPPVPPRKVLNTLLLGEDGPGGTASQANGRVGRRQGL